MADITCSYCGHINSDSATHCVECNTLLTKATTPTITPANDDNNGVETAMDLADYVATVLQQNDALITGKLGAIEIPKELVLTHEESNTQFHINQEHLDDVFIGHNTANNQNVVVDLTGVGQEKNGVSRRHASLFQKGRFLMLVDHDSLHGTFLNGSRVMPEQSRIVRDSDMIRLGAVVLRVNYNN